MEAEKAQAQEEKRRLLCLALDGIIHSLELEEGILKKQMFTVQDEMDSLNSPLTASIVEGYIAVIKQTCEVGVCLSLTCYVSSPHVR